MNNRVNVATSRTRCSAPNRRASPLPPPRHFKNIEGWRNDEQHYQRTCTETDGRTRVDLFCGCRLLCVGTFLQRACLLFFSCARWEHHRLYSFRFLFLSRLCVLCLLFCVCAGLLCIETSEGEKGGETFLQKHRGRYTEYIKQGDDESRASFYCQLRRPHRWKFRRCENISSSSSGKGDLPYQCGAVSCE